MSAEGDRTRKRMKAWVDRQMQRVAHVHREACFDVLRNVVVGGPYSPGTPVDKGNARDSWTLGPAGTAPKTFVPDGPVRDKSGEAVLLESKTTLEGLRPLGTVVITTACPYMPRLETGWSQQAPAGMVRSTISAWPSIVQDAARRVRSGRTYTAKP